jgi:hypothetical protein
VRLHRFAHSNSDYPTIFCQDLIDRSLKPDLYALLIEVRLENPHHVLRGLVDGKNPPIRSGVDS